jgi:carbon monoxide dehydrogenase subunit G
MDHEHSTYIPVPPDRLYQAIADVENLTRYIPPLKSVRPTTAERVEVEAQYEGHQERGEAWFRTDDAERKVEWGSEGHPYRGSMQVEPDGDGSHLTFHLTTSHASDIEEYVNRTFESIRKLV